MQLSEKLLQVARLGGPIVLWMLIALSVLSIGIIVERWWWFFRRRANLRQLGDDLLTALREGDLEHARAVLGASAAPAAAIVADALDWYGHGADAFREILDKGLRDRRKDLESGLLFLGTLGNNAPFIGLFGTVLGIVTAFRELGGNQMGAMGNVMSGIAEALLATAIGILVAIPAVVFYNMFQKKGSEIEEHAAALGNVLIASMKGSPRVNGVKRDAREVEHPGRTVEMEA